MTKKSPILNKILFIKDMLVKHGSPLGFVIAKSLVIYSDSCTIEKSLATRNAPSNTKAVYL